MFLASLTRLYISSGKRLKPLHTFFGRERIKGVLWCCRNYAPAIQVQDVAVREKAGSKYCGCMEIAST